MRICAQDRETYDVVAGFHRRNRVPRPPKPARLREIQQAAQPDVTAESDESDDEDPGSDNDEEPTNQTRAARHSHRPYSATTINPKRLRFYPPMWREILTDAKSRCRAWMATECAFPVPSKPEHREAAGDCIRAALSNHEDDGGLVEEGSLLQPCVPHSLLIAA
jgi:hypothetical protein